MNESLKRLVHGRGGSGFEPFGDNFSCKAFVVQD